MTRILVTGANGLLGSKIVTKAMEMKKHNVFPSHATKAWFTNSVRMDITRKSEVHHAFHEIEPSIVIHAAAETRVDLCEERKDLALAVNAEGSKTIAEACRMIGAKLVYISTDYVFDGETGYYSENHEPNPINYYGLTKLLGERHVAQICQDFLILRTSVLYGEHKIKDNFASWVAKTLEKAKQLNVVVDHYNSPTLADNLADVVLELISNDLQGIYHAAGSERISRYQFAVTISSLFGLDSSLIHPIEMEKLGSWVAKRPKDSSLCVEKLQGVIGTPLLGVSEGLERMRGDWLETK